MSLTIETFVLGELQNNTYVLVDTETKQIVVVDPAMRAERLLERMHTNRWHLSAVWLTHAHFDHTAGINALVSELPNLAIGLHPDDLPLYRQGGGARYFGLEIPPLPEPNLMFSDGQWLEFAGEEILVRHAPGHCPGHVVFSLTAQRVVLCGDLIFRHSIGRTDLPGGSSRLLFDSIDRVILSLPPETRLLSGHGPETTVDEERRYNPFLMP